MLSKLTDQIAPVLDSDEYPRRWQDYIGQEPAKRMLKVAAKSARMRKEPLDHVLIAHGSAGVGKTALAALVAAELRTPARIVSGQIGVGKARLILSEMEDGQVLIMDEIHQLVDNGKKHAEWMIHLLQDNVLMGPLGPEPQPRITIIGTTTEAARLPESIVSRFLQAPMQEYTHEEATKIAQAMGTKVLVGLPKMTATDAAGIAMAAHNNPRAIRNLLRVLRDMTITDELPLVKGRYDVAGLLAYQGITHDGLDLVAQRYLQVLAMEFAGTAGAKAIEDRLQQPGGLGPIERMLMDKGLVAKTRTGRTLTQAGIKRFRELSMTG